MLIFSARNSAICIPSFILFEKTNRGRMVWFYVVVLLIHSGVIWFYHGLNSAAAMLLFTIVLLHTSLILALVFIVI